MSGISVLQQLSPPTHAPGLLPAQTASQGSTSTLADEEIRRIKDSARETVARETRNVSSISVLTQAKKQLELAQALQNNGDYPGSLRSFYISAELMSKSMDSPEFKSGVLKREVTDFVSKDGRDLMKKTTEVEKQLRTILATGGKAPQANGIIKQSGGSITDRLRSLEGAAGTTIKTTKPLAKDLPKLNGTAKRETLKRDSPMRTTFGEESIVTPSPRPAPSNLGLLLPTSPSSSTHTVPPTPASAAPSTPHSFVPTSSFGPPSPSSSPATSPRTVHHNLPSVPQQPAPDELEEFKHNFPSIEELDASLFPTKTGESSGSGRMHTGESSSSTKFSTTFPPVSAMPTGSSIASKRDSLAAPMKHPPPPPLVTNGDVHGQSSPSFRPFVMPIERPSSTPIVPTTNSFGSRPASPGPLSPSTSFQTKASALSAIPAVPEETAARKEANLISPAEVADFIGKSTQMLLLDVRTRSEFLQEHIDARVNAMICIEPSVLTKPGASYNTIDEALAASTMNDASLFRFRHNFERIVLYDQSSTSFGHPSSPLSILAAIVSAPTANSTLKHPALLMVGGLDAWKREGRDLKVPMLPAITSHHTPRQLPLSPAPAAVIPPMSPPAPQPDARPPPLKPAPGLDSLGKMVSSAPSSSTPHQPIVYPTHMRTAAEFTPPLSSPPLPNDASQPTSLTRKPAITRSAGSSASASASTSFSRTEPQLLQRPSPISYPQISGRMTSASTSIPPSIASPPASLSRRRSDYIDQAQEALSSSRHAPNHSVDYPNLPAAYSSSMAVLRPPPPAAAPTTERQDNRPRIPPKPSFTSPTVPSPPKIPSQVEIFYWSDQVVATTGMRNMGNTCYMSSTIQCLCATWPFARFFASPSWTSAINMTNPLGSKGNLAIAFSMVLRELGKPDNTYIVPKNFRTAICKQNQQYLGSDQHDSQEFLSFLLDGIHEDLNRVIGKPEVTKTKEQEAELERLPPQIAGEQEWQLWTLRNDSIIVDWFQGQFYNRLQCTTCGQTSTTYNAFSLLSLPIPGGKSKRVPLLRCFDAFCNRELLEGDDAWDCTRCKTKRSAGKELHLSRLPPVLIIHLKRFESDGRFSDKIDTFVDFPLKGLDLDPYMPPPLPAGSAKGALSSQLSSSDPRKQSPPYRYDLYAVTNHYGNLSSGHYTAFIASGGHWLYCDDSSIKKVDPKDVINQKAYVLFYKRVKA